MADDDRNLEKAEREAEGRIATLDLRLVRAAQPLADNALVKAVGKASELADQPPLIAASLAVAVAGLGRRDGRLLRTGLRMLAAHALATGIKTVIKDNFDRPRPRKVGEQGEHAIERGDSSDGEDRSLPSGHSAGAFAVARAIACEHPAAAPVAHVAATAASVVQVPRKAHFPSDVVVGVIIGLAAEAIVSLATRKLGFDSLALFRRRA